MKSNPPFEGNKSTPPSPESSPSQESIIPKEVKEAPRERVIERIVEKPIEVIKEVVKEVPVEKIIERVMEKPVEVIKEVPVEKIVEKVIEKPVEIIKEVPVEKIVEKEVIGEVPVFDEKKAQEELRQRLTKARPQALITKRGKRNQKLFKIIDYTRAKGKITNNEAQLLLGATDRTVARYLSLLIKEGRLKEIGKTGRSVIYVIS